MNAREPEVPGTRFDEIPDWDVLDIDWGRGWVSRGPVRLTVGI